VGDVPIEVYPKTRKMSNCCPS